ncbi:exodeoxyribonuclease V subunit alpha [Cellulomonas marina]|uniref:RecBCD enzyme subunit RecD n=1 Tax=Cellulomonas marina TaxID=988821 RepID=A0A1I0ZDI7_9CELL|nr:exodeoxyribonuclease V subunit alpha [Cellulomonas marina]GIG28989.1 RecBCD enzyme subunit RecD [Cellulomonas marina]SFB22610.1 DNA helicase/exodeoxyribonuclease V, alpha subunit [Cellulomonas marina]
MTGTTAHGTPLTPMAAENGTSGLALPGSVPWRAEGLLAPFVAAGLLVAADVHVARRLAAVVAEADERVLLAVALAVRAVRGGSVCVRLDEVAALPVDEDIATEGAASGSAASGSAASGSAASGGAVPLPWPDLAGPDGWHAAVRRSRLVADGPEGPADRPVRWVDGRVYLDRYWRDELTVRTLTAGRVVAASPSASAHDGAAVEGAVLRLFPRADDERQRDAVRTAARLPLTVLTGGPGTGKTTTVARLVAALASTRTGGPLRVALAAPTGKAAARLQESVEAELRGLDPADRAAVGPVRATTLHRLLGPLPGTTTRFRHDAGRRLPHDLVVVDESSMVSLTLMARLLAAVRPGAHVVLVGDPDQLSSVEAGAVLADLVAALPAGVVRLERVHRFGTELAELAEAVRRGDADTAVALLRAGGASRELVEPAGPRPAAEDLGGLRADVLAAGRALTEAARTADAAGALTALARHRLLLAHRQGPAGVAWWAAVVEHWLAEAEPSWRGRAPCAWPPGTPLLVTENDPVAALSNGDTGVVLDDGSGGTVVAFGDPAAPVLVRPYRLPAVQPVHAMTVHRGQGSQFARVTVLLPPAASPLLTRELLYTAITRAREHVRVIGGEEAVRRAVEQPVRRASGLREPLPSSVGTAPRPG